MQNSHDLKTRTSVWLPRHRALPRRSSSQAPHLRTSEKTKHHEFRRALGSAWFGIGLKRVNALGRRQGLILVPRPVGGGVGRRFREYDAVQFHGNFFFLLFFHAAVLVRDDQLELVDAQHLCAVCSDGGDAVARLQRRPSVALLARLLLVLPNHLHVQISEANMTGC